MAGAVARDGLVIGFDGSQMLGREQVAAELGRIFADHETASYVTKVRSVTAVGDSGRLSASETRFDIWVICTVPNGAVVRDF